VTALAPLAAPPSPKIDLKALVERAGGDPLAARPELLELLRAELKAAREAARQKLEGGAGGLEVAYDLAAATDRVVTTLWAFTTRRLYPAVNPTEGERLALLAVGGYGRGVMAPFSDVDLLFLRAWKPTPHSESVVEFMLYALWDLGLKVGSASRSVEECLRHAREDVTIRTTLLEMRLLAGDAGLVEELRHRFRAEIVRGTERAFVAAKLDERDARHFRTGASRYLVEPNVKDGKGGLRDLHTLFWIAQYLDPTDEPAEIVDIEAFTPRDRRALERALDFLWAVRANLHFLRGRAEDRLVFDLQPEIAGRMGFVGRTGEPAVERFMRRYFMTAKEVGALTRVFCAKLEADQTKAPQGLSRLLFLPRRTPRRFNEPGFVEEGGRLMLERPDLFERDPTALLRIFRLADREDLDLHPDAFTAVTRNLNHITPSLRRDPEAVDAFLDLLARGRSPYRTLGLMNDAGVLGRFIPEFGRITAQMQFAMRHVYTVDEHTLQAVGVVHDIEHGRLEEDHPLSTNVFPLIEDKEAVYLATLLHDLGKGGARGQEAEGAAIARRVCERMGLEPPRVEAIQWLVRNHLVLSNYAQKRDFSDPDTLAAFVKMVGTPERLRMLLILTVADIRAVGPGVWNGWKGQLMRELYAEADAVFRGGRDVDPATRVRGRQADEADAARALLTAEDPQAEAFAREMDDSYFTSFSHKAHLAHAALARRAAAEGGAAAIASPNPDRNALELVVATADRPGLFADLTEALAGIGADVVGARAFTSASGRVLDAFFVQDAAGSVFGAEHPGDVHRAIRALAQAARKPAAARGVPPPPPAPAVDRDPARAMIDNESSAAATVVEVSGRDRPGFLSAIARALTLQGLSIQSAHVDCYGERAVDAFYVQDDEGRKIVDPERLAAIREALVAAAARPPLAAGLASA
jgi:[protein-PII] uridylyltransferase